MIWALVAVLALGGGGDPRLEIVSAQLAGDDQRALTLAEQLLASQPDSAQAMGLDYLRGDLLERLGRHREADRAFASVMSGARQLAPYARYRLALSQSRRGHPEVAAGLVASVLAGETPKALVEPGVRLLSDAIARGGDCRLLQNMSGWDLRGPARRLLEITAIDCALPTAAAEESIARLLRLLEETTTDEAARLASERLDRLFSGRITNRHQLILVGQAFHHQRRFDLAIDYLQRGLRAPISEDLEQEVRREARYALARSHFWRAEYLDAVFEFGRVADAAANSEDAAGALYQQGRSYELYGSRVAAANSFRQAYLEDSDGRWSAAALLSVIRLEWLRGEEGEALATLEVLGSRRAWAEMHARGALFLAASDLATGRSDRAESWLEMAQRMKTKLGAPLAFWSARLAELQLLPERAVPLYLEIVAEAPFDPFAQLARQRLEGEALVGVARRMGETMAKRSDPESLYRAWLLLGDSGEETALLDRALAGYRKRSGSQSFFELAIVAPEAWPLWKDSLREPEEMLVAAGLWDQGVTATFRHFPASEVSLGYTGSRLLSSAGEHRRALQRAETLYEGASKALPEALIPVPLRRAAFPLPYGTQIAAAAARHQVDPFLLTAIIREESRFDADAVSSAAARGLTQFIQPTAERLAARAGLQAVTAEDLHRPPVSIALGAAYLEELMERYADREHQAIAAYNAGENQAELWFSYCLSDDPAEFLTKVGFPETRNYLRKVLSSREQYRDLYPPATLAAE